jgi:hypothetical protein
MQAGLTSLNKLVARRAQNGWTALKTRSGGESE